MKKWNKQILSVLLALAMCLGMFPVSVFAEGDDQTVQEPAFTSVTESVVVKPTDETAAIEASVNFAYKFTAEFIENNGFPPSVRRNGSRVGADPGRVCADPGLVPACASRCSRVGAL